MKPLTLKETYLARMAGEDVTMPEPLTREEAYMKGIATALYGGEAETPEPLTRDEAWMQKIASNIKNVENIQAEIMEYHKLDNEGRVVFFADYSHRTLDHVEVGVLLINSTTVEGNLTHETQGVIVNPFATDEPHFNARDKGTGIYVRPYMKFGEDYYVYGKQVFTTWEDAPDAPTT